MPIKQILHLMANILVLAAIMFACANPVAPTGGPKDEDAPKFIGSNPVNKSRNLKPDKVYLAFDEFVELKDLNKNLLVSPPFQNKLDIKTKGKGVRVLFDKNEVFAENTTYTIYFGDAITDLHENNPLPNFQYVFATGNDIDSLSIRGKILEANFLIPQEGVTVCLYIDNNDTLSLDELPQKVRPYYIGRTNKEGYFEINNIKNDRFLLFAVKDANANFINDMPNEAIAFSKELIVPEEVFDFIPDSIPIDTSNVKLMDSLWANFAVPITKNSHTLLYYEPQDSVQRIVSKELVDGNHMLFKFKYPLKNELDINLLQPENIEKSAVFMEEYSSEKDSLILWFYKPFKDTIQIKFKMDTLKTDTFNIIFNTPSKKDSESGSRVKSVQSAKRQKAPTIAYTANFSNNFPYFAQGRIIFKTPIITANFDNIILYEDTIPVAFEIGFKDKIKRKLSVEYAWKEGKKYRLEIPDQALTDIHGLKNDSIFIRFKTTTESNYGSLEMNISLPNDSTSQWIVQLIKGSADKEQLIQKEIIRVSSTAVFKNLNAEKYRVKILEDIDGNGRWSSGDYSKKQLPEKVFYFDKTIEIKSGWEIKEDWKIDYSAQENPSVKVEKTKK